MFRDEIVGTVADFREFGIPPSIPRKGKLLQADRLVQVCIDIAPPATLERECAPLAESARYFGVNDCCIVTLDQERTIAHDGITIRAIPAWKWLLEE